MWCNCICSFPTLIGTPVLISANIKSANHVAAAQVCKIMQKQIEFQFIFMLTMV